MFSVRTCYSLLRGTARPAAVVDRAAELGHRVLLLADEASLAGAPEFWTACRRAGVVPVIGARVSGRVLVARNRAGYAGLCRRLTDADAVDVEGLLEFPGDAVEDVVCAAPREWRLHRLLSAIRQNALVVQVGDLAPPSAYLREDLALGTDERDLLESCAWDFLPAPKVFPRDQGGMERLRILTERGLARRYGASPPRDRVERELGLIGTLGYADYFLVVHDIVAHSRERGLPVAGRGSGASSVVAYALGITNVCPIRFELPFERFLHEERRDYPDIDVDFSWRVRDEVLAHVFRTWPDSAMVSSHITFQARSAFREAAKAYGYSDAQVDALRKGRIDVPDRARLEAAAAALLGLPRHLSVHPGGVVLHPDGVAPLVPAEKGVRVTQYDKDTVEQVGLVKIDLLGNRALSTIRETTELVERETGWRIDPEALPERDGAAEALLAEARTLGCNQLESPAMRSLIRKLRPRDAKGLMQALALIRPGAAAQGGKEAFVRRARGEEAVPPALRALFPDTHGLLIYEDDAMLAAAAAAGMTLAEGDRFRKRVQKASTRDAAEAEFLARASADPGLARELWAQMAKFGEFSFCRAHAASYGVLAWASAWLAAHEPAAHWTAALNNNQGLYEARTYVEQARREGIATRPPCVQRSGVEFTLEDGAIRTGLGRIAGLEERELGQILEQRPFSSIGDFLERTRISKPSLRALALSGAFDWTGEPRPRALLRLLSKGGRGAPSLGDFTEAEKFRHEMELLGISTRGHPLSFLAPGPRAFDSRGLAGAEGRRVTLLGVMATRRIAMTSGNEAMEFLTLEDEYGVFEAVLFPNVFRRYRRLIGTLGPYEVTGRGEGGGIRVEAIGNSRRKGL
jgi:DNA polymerase III alpha subunit